LDNTIWYICHILSFGEVLSQQPVRIFICSALPRLLRLGVVEFYSVLTLTDFFVVIELAAAVGRYALAWLSFQQLDDRLSYVGCCFLFYFLPDDEIPRQFIGLI